MDNTINNTIIVLDSDKKRRLAHRRNGLLGNIGMAKAQLNHILNSRSISKLEKERVQDCLDNLMDLNFMFRKHKSKNVIIQKINKDEAII